MPFRRFRADRITRKPTDRYFLSGNASRSHRSGICVEAHLSYKCVGSMMKKRMDLASPKTAGNRGLLRCKRLMHLGYPYIGQFPVCGPRSGRAAFLLNPDIPEFDWLWERSREDRQSRDLIATKGYVRAQPL